MKVIVFGGAGFVGSHVVEELLHQGRHVTVFDRNAPGFEHPALAYVEGDILDRALVHRAVAGHEVLFNFAGQPDIGESFDRPYETVSTNVLGCQNQLDAAVAAGVTRFVLASTIYVYSTSGGFYRVSKQACELLVEEYQRSIGLDYTILRFGSLYGRRADERNSVRRYLREALTERRIVAYGNGDERREYIHVHDAAKCSVAILADEFRNQHIILTGHEAVRLRDLLEMIREIVGREVAIEYHEPGDGRGHGHYKLTPYTYQPRVGKKMVSPVYADLGQGLLDCLEEIHDSHATANEHR